MEEGRGMVYKGAYSTLCIARQGHQTQTLILTTPPPRTIYILQHHHAVVRRSRGQLQ